MAQPFSEETEALLDRAGRAIQQSIVLCEHTRRCLAEAERRSFEMELYFRSRTHRDGWSKTATHEPNKAAASASTAIELS